MLLEYSRMLTRFCPATSAPKPWVAVLGPSPTKAIPVIKVILRNIQRSDLNLLAAYRKIPILSAPPAGPLFDYLHPQPATYA